MSNEDLFRLLLDAYRAEYLRERRAVGETCEEAAVALWTFERDAVDDPQPWDATT